MNTVYEPLDEPLEKSGNDTEQDQDAPSQYANHELAQTDHITIISPPGSVRIRCPVLHRFFPVGRPLFHNAMGGPPSTAHDRGRGQKTPVCGTREAPAWRVAGSRACGCRRGGVFGAPLGDPVDGAEPDLHLGHDLAPGAGPVRAAPRSSWRPRPAIHNVAVHDGRRSCRDRGCAALSNQARSSGAFASMRRLMASPQKVGRRDAANLRFPSGPGSGAR